MKRPGDPALTQLSNVPVAAQRPGRVVSLKGVIFQSDASSVIGALFIRPLETFDRWQAGLARTPGDEPLAMHAGLHVAIEDGREFVAEQLVGSLFEDFEDALNWTPLEAFRRRETTGWDVTVPATAFRGIDDATVAEAVANLSTVRGHAFLGEDCTMFIERVFGGRRLFGDSPTGQALGVGLRVGDPALPLLRPDAELDPRARRLLRVSVVSQQPDPLAAPDALNAHLWFGRIVVWSVVLAFTAGVAEAVRCHKRRKRRWWAFWR